MFSASTATALNHIHPSHVEGANFLNLMIVDEDGATREACRDVTRSPSFGTQGAESAEQACRLRNSLSMDAILLDLPAGRTGSLAYDQAASPRSGSDRGDRL